jgi:uncharacterized protein (TIGR02266 family)
MPSKKERRARERRLSQQPSVERERRSETRRAESERRAELRVPIDLWMEEVRGDEVYFRRSCNLSEGGVLFEQSIPYPVGTRLHLRFTLPGGLRELATQGEVVSAAKEKDGLGMGVKFLDLPPPERAGIRAYLHTLLLRRSGQAT